MVQRVRKTDLVGGSAGARLGTGHEACTRPKTAILAIVDRA
jgi:hypothetical protein